MNRLLYPFTAGVFAFALTAVPSMARQSQQSGQQTTPPSQQSQSQQQSQPSQNTAQAQQTQSTQQTIDPNVPPPPPPDAQTAQPPATQSSSKAAAGQSPAGNDAPIQQQDQPNVKKGSEDDVDAIGNRGVGKGVDFYSIEKEIALGKQLAQQVERTSKLVDDPIIVEYVNRVGQNLVRNSDCKVPFTIKVIDSDVINAFALPGGFFYVNSGLVLRASEEAELAGVMGHEIAHVCARHGTRNETKAQIMELATIPLMIVLPPTMASYGIYEAAQFAIPMAYLKFSREAEAEADHLGVEYMWKAGYDPNAYVAFFEKILAEEKREPGHIPKMFADHPPTPDRIKATQREIATILPARDSYIVSTSEFDTVKARLMAYEHRNKIKTNQPGKPTLRSKTEQKNDPNATTTNTSDSDDSDRPVLKKRTDSTQGNGCASGSGSGGSTGTSTGTSTSTGTNNTNNNGCSNNGTIQN
jgi:beta-barrel assembly-enhancing protease